MSQHANMDPRETEKFGKLIACWWDPRGPMHSLHAINPLRMNFITEAIEPSGRQALDVGCGGGILSESLARSGAQVTGIDLSEALVELAGRHADEQGLHMYYRHASAEQLAEKEPASFDITTCMEVLEHIPEPEQVVAACSRILRPGGHAFFSTINRNLKSFLFAILGAEYILHLLPMGSHKYSRLIQPDELRAWAEKSGLSFVNSSSLAYDPFNGKFSMVPHEEDINYMMHFIRN